MSTIAMFDTVDIFAILSMSAIDSLIEVVAFGDIMPLVASVEIIATVFLLIT